MTSIVENIKHYQKSIDRALNDESRVSERVCWEGGSTFFIFNPAGFGARRVGGAKSYGTVLKKRGFADKRVETGAESRQQRGV